MVGNYKTPSNSQRDDTLDTQPIGYPIGAEPGIDASTSMAQPCVGFLRVAEGGGQRGPAAGVLALPASLLEQGETGLPPWICLFPNMLNPVKHTVTRPTGQKDKYYVHLKSGERFRVKWEPDACKE